MRLSEEEYQAIIDKRNTTRGAGNGLPPSPLPRPVVMNKTEAAYSRHLDVLKSTGEILDWVFEPFRIILAAKTTYLPDFLVIKQHFEIHEVKGFMRDDAAVKIKVAASLFPWWKFIIVKKAKEGWSYKEVKV